MSEQSEPRKSRIPEFSNIEKEAEFWDTHDTTEFEDEFKPVQVRFAKNLSEGFFGTASPPGPGHLATQCSQTLFVCYTHPCYLI